MAENGSFDRLVSGLSLDERHNLLTKLKGQSNLSEEPLYAAETNGSLNGDAQYERLPWYFRVWFFVVSVFKSRPPEKVFEDGQVAQVGKQIEERSPGLYDYQKALLLPAFYRQMEQLKEASRFFYTALDAGFNRDKGAFFGFLGSLEMGPIHRRLQDETDPVILGEENPKASEAELRQMALKAMDNAMAEVTDEIRNTMYFDARALYCLKELSSFLFDRIIMAFAFNTMVNGDACSVAVVRELLVTLNNILVSLKNIPPMPLLESLFVFLLQEKSGEKNFNIDSELKTLLTKAENALAVVREFNRQVPLTKILRCASRNMSLTPREISGGEDWFVIYREYWKNRVEAAFSGYIRNRRRREVLDSFRSFLKGTNLKLLGYAAADASSDGIPVRGAFSLSFLLTFYPVVFIPDIKDALQTIFIDGDFGRKENRVEFDEAYNNLMKLEDEIRKFEARLSPSGLYGERYEQANQDMASLPAKRRKAQIVVEEASAEALEIVDMAKGASRSMINILSSIASTEQNGKHGFLSNLQKLADKDPKFVNSITDIIQKFQNVIRILDDIDVMDVPK